MHIATRLIHAAYVAVRLAVATLAAHWLTMFLYGAAAVARGRSDGLGWALYGPEMFGLYIVKTAVRVDAIALCGATAAAFLWPRLVVRLPLFCLLVAVLLFAGWLERGFGHDPWGWDILRIMLATALFYGWSAYRPFGRR